ncbi:hypothetical protein [Hydrogenophaga sp. BPS33]|uniref:hypothetical protein n=1 Tax=Hydrogenophaga sp. BPS33 TaxID=2651974 RepID=UPI00131FA4BA|nr:hypothetical protein [Hydrogenophaga sp. BPS33]QHE88233.1 hypothetical protein F9K07_26785 [Hydrogenophaga sp. BPS33]
MSVFPHALAPIFTALSMALSTFPAVAQTPPAAAWAATACASPDEMSAPQLYGLWQFHLWPVQGGDEARPASSGAALFEKHPEYPGSVRGNLKRSTAGNDRQAVVSGDVSNGDEFNLDESADGVAMDAVWEGQVTPGTCGQEIRGIRRPAEGGTSSDVPMSFVLKKSQGWR